MTDNEKRMDRFDAIVCEHLRSTKGRAEALSIKIGCSSSSLWRYRTQKDAFQRMPLEIFANVMRMANVSNENLRYILGLPTGKSEDVR